MALEKPSRQPASRKEAILSRREIEHMIAKGHTVFITSGRVIKADAWLRFHPGGDKAVKHMVGRDATDEVHALHSTQTLEYMTKYQIGRINGYWRNFLPPIQGGAFRTIDEAEEAGEEQRLQYAESSSSQGSSPLDSPLFDPVDQDESRRRKRHLNDDETSSISSTSTMELTPLEMSKNLSHMDVYTQEAIDLDLAKYPPLDAATQNVIVQKYRLLQQRIQAEGLYKCNYTAYLIEFCRYVLLLAMFLTFLHYGWYGTSGAFLGLTWHQLVFTVHDAGHMGITHDFQTDTVIGMLIADYIGGLSLGWWKRNHNVHHVVTNSPEHDPDIEHMPFFAISHRFLNSLRSTYYDRIMTYDTMAKYMIRYQHLLYYPILLLGRFNLYRLSWEFLIQGQGPRKGPARWHRWFEIAGHVFFWFWFGYLVLYKAIPTTGGRISFLLISHMITGPLHVQITLSHFAMSTADHGVDESFPQKMLRTTMDVDCPQWLDFVHGGLQFQAIHHLYPRIPRHNLRRTQKLVQEFCHEVEIPYALYGFVDGNKEVLGRLADVGRQAAILAECQKTIASQGNIAIH
ncbi:uncharacterized protein KY384_006017 [Bacidia gigantensis]|uniref:uncharacterized protein n=1 Tax=Bacidia gigantensis TaxID=2732470 RepID=UPI001D03D1AE|nr:uncharacterized protein KY384_006017 [Bacidia gigantensis]KAG8529381.1 hypothetical protein KY384_006017 [Bacidia gigantensis]